MGVEDFAIKNGVLTKYKGAGGDVVIPEGVTEIGEDAFLGCSSLESVSIPEGVREIGEDAFAFCKSLKSVTIPEGVKKIGRDAFRGCGSLKTISTPGSVAEIGASAFRDCSSLEAVSIPEGVTEIGEGAFDGCESLKSVSLPGSVAEIGEGAFEPDTVLVSPHLSTNAAKGKRISKASIAAGRVIYALENPGHDLDDATRKYIRAQLPGVCKALRYDAAAILWIADNGLVSGAAAAKAATACTEKGLTEVAAVLLDASAASKKKSKLRL